jgi:transposase
MVNQLKMDKVSAITCLHRRGWSSSRIARELGVHRTTVSRYIGLFEAEPGIMPCPPPWADSKPTPNPTPGDFQNRQNPPPGSTGPPSACEPYREAIVKKLELGLSGVRIWQDLREEYGFPASYSSVKRYIKKLGKTTPLPFRRMESNPGEEAQVDFGTGAPVITPEGKRRKTHVLRVTLSCSRKSYSESVFRQTTESFIRCIEDAFWHFGGVPGTLVIDNLKAAVTKADWYDPEINPKLESFCRHYGTVILPTKPYTPRHKGKIEKGIDYVKDNALKGRKFKSLEEQNKFLLEWEENIADLRIHGTTRKQVKKVFEEIERPTLLPLPTLRFPFFYEGERSVHRDGHVEVDKSYYSVPPEYVCRKVWVRWDSRLVRVFNGKFEEIAVHAKKESGRFSTNPGHIPSEKMSMAERGATYLLNKASMIGENAEAWSNAMLKERGVRGIRVLQGLLSLVGKHRCQELDRACKTALEYGAYRLKVIKTLLTTTEKQTTFEFTQEHQIIRNMTDYGRFARVSFREGETKIKQVFGRFTASGAGPVRGEAGPGKRLRSNEEENTDA